MNNISRHIRSYVRREGRMTDSQKTAIEYYWNTFGIDFSPSKITLDSLFQRNAPRVLDIGTGMGNTTITLARAHPENDYLAVEVHRPGIGSLLRQIAEHHLQNIRISNHDVLEVLKIQIPENSLDMVYIFFPDPWPKKRHHKRRLINHSFLDVLGNCMKSHARLFIATDWENYAEHILELFSKRNDYINLSGNDRFAPRPYWRPLTKFEQRGQKLEHRVRDFIFGRR